MSKFFIIVNYVARGLMMLMGLIVVVMADVLFPNTDKNFVYVIGAVMILFGLYRMVSFHTKMIQYQQRSLREETEE